MSREDIVSKPIHDKNGKLIGNITGRKSEIERFKNNDLNDQLQRDRSKHKDQVERRR